MMIVATENGKYSYGTTTNNESGWTNINLKYF